MKLLNTFFLSILLCVHFAVSGKVHVVKPGGLSIKETILLANNHDSIWVLSGYYLESDILVQKPLFIYGENFPVIDGEMKNELFTVNASNVTVQGFKLINSGTSSMNDLAGVKVLDGKNVTVINNKFENTFFAIYLSNSKNCLIQDNQIFAEKKSEHQSGNGIHLWKCEHIKIHGNSIKGHRDGIYFEFVTHSEISHNISEGNLRYGLHFMFSHEDIYFQNTFRNNGAGVAVMYSNKVTMKENVFDNNWGSASYGLLLKDISDSEAHGNLFIGNTTGIYMEGTSRTNFTGNLFQENGWAVKLQASCDDNVFTGNNFVANTFDISTNGTTVLNTLDGNYWDRYEGYDMNKDGIGDIPYRPSNIFTMVVERMPVAMLLWRSFLVALLDRAEKVIPAMTPINFKDDKPMMKAYDINKEFR
jgi:nitrous oxidase accessory protein